MRVSLQRRGMTEPTVTRTKVRFDSSGVESAGYLYRPARASGALPCVVLGHGGPDPV